MDCNGGILFDIGTNTQAATYIMSEKKKFLLRLDGDVYSALEKWAADDLRSANAQIEFLLKEMLKKAGRLKAKEESEE